MTNVAKLCFIGNFCLQLHELVIYLSISKFVIDFALNKVSWSRYQQNVFLQK